MQERRVLSRRRARSGPVFPAFSPAFLLYLFLAAALACLAPCRGLAQEAPPLEADGPPQTAAPARVPARPKAASPGPAASAKPASLKPGAGNPGPGAPRVLRPGAAPAPASAPVPARPVARGPAVKNDGKRYLRSLDENHDGRISREEFLARSKHRFDKLDLNRDGVISAQEAKVGQAELRKRKAASDARRLAQGKPVKKKAKSDRPARPYLSGSDANKDGRVSRREYLARREKAFAELDLNRDGVVSRDEAKAGKARKLARREERKAEARERQARKKSRAEAAASPAPQTEDAHQPPVHPPPAGPPL